MARSRYQIRPHQRLPMHCPLHLQPDETTDIGTRSNASVQAPGTVPHVGFTPISREGEYSARKPLSVSGMWRVDLVDAFQRRRRGKGLLGSQMA